MHATFLLHNVIFKLLIITGKATRYCDNRGSWSEPNVLNCVSVVFLDIEQFVSPTQTLSLVASLLIVH